MQALDGTPQGDVQAKSLVRSEDAAALCQKISTCLEKAETAVKKAEQFYTTAALHIRTLQEQFPQTWQLLLKEHCGFGRSRAFEILAIAEGRVSVEAIRESNAERQRISRERTKQQESVTSRTPEPPDEMGSRNGQIGQNDHSPIEPAAASDAAQVETVNLGNQDDISVSEDVEDPAIVLSNILDSIQRAQSVARAWRKILKLSSFDRGAKKQISDEIDLLIRNWRSVAALKTLATEGDDPEQSAEAMKAAHAALEQPASEAAS